MSESESLSPSSSKPQVGWSEVARAAAERIGGSAVDASGAEHERELLVFGLDGAAYGIPVDRVREIVRMKKLTPVPCAPEWLLGVVALRGEVVEVIDLRQRLGLAAAIPDRTHRIIVLHGEGDRVAGLLVDSVSEVYRIPEDRMIPAQGLEISCVSEMCPRGDKFVSILDVDRAIEVSDV